MKDCSHSSTKTKDINVKICISKQGEKRVASFEVHEVIADAEENDTLKSNLQVHVRFAHMRRHTVRRVERCVTLEKVLLLISLAIVSFNLLFALFPYVSQDELF